MIGGLPPKEGPLSEGYYAIPTIFANVANDWRLAREEIFGPVLVAICDRSSTPLRPVACDGSAEKAASYRAN